MYGTFKDYVGKFFIVKKKVTFLVYMCCVYSLFIYFYIYIAEQANLPALNDAQRIKLKHLSIVALSESSRVCNHLIYKLSYNEYINS